MSNKTFSIRFDSSDYHPQTRMEFLTNDVIRRLIESSGLTGEVACVSSDLSDSGIGNGENYCSDIVRMKLNLTLKSGKSITKALILKVFLKNLSSEAFKEMKLFFSNEIVMYDKILVKFGQLAEKHKLKDPILWSNCYFGSTDVVILDDLNEEGYFVVPRHNGLTLEDSIHVMRYLGRFHALSVVADKRKLIDPSIIRRTYCWVDLSNITSKFIKKSFIIVSDIVTQWGEQWKEAGKNILHYSEIISSMINNLYFEDVPLRVVNHGDAWINNILFKYDRNGHVESLRFVDFQNATYNSIGWELIYFLFSSLQGDLMMTNFDRLLESYREEFVLSQEQMEEDTILVPSIEDIKKDIHRLLPFCLTMSCTMTALVANISDEPIQVDELVNNDSKLRGLFTSQVWCSSMQSHIKYYQQHNFL